ncbi:hypothetical protein [Afipia birgiae]|uniref:hypothetical protein n=1 Tax=Afipia birgiae TaxID=151414 RepID=UPI0012EB09FB|nr:hypothetical protein [Afipia birgiae]
MQHHDETTQRSASIENFTHHGRTGCDPARLLTVAEYWVQFDEPIEFLEDPAATFAGDGQSLIAICEANDIPYRPAGTVQAAGFPVWLLMEFYPANP